MATRTVTAHIEQASGAPWSGGVVRFRLTPHTYRESPAQTYPEDVVVATTDAGGNLTQALVSGDDARYVVTLPSGDRVAITVPDGDATTLEALRDGLPLWTPLSLGKTKALYLGDAIEDGEAETIALWRDDSGRGFDMVQSVAGDRPTAHVALNGHTIARFDDDFLEASIAAGTFPNGFQATIVFQKTGAAAGATEMGVVVRTVSNQPRPYDRRDDDMLCGSPNTTLNLPAHNISNMTTWTILSSSVSATRMAEWRNGVLSGETLVVNGYTDTATTVRMGRRADGATFFRGDVALVGLTDELNDAERQRFEGWAAHALGINGTLDASHPYKTFPPLASL